jgi:hypothetical protein
MVGFSRRGAHEPTAVHHACQQSKNIPTVGVLRHAGSAEEEDVYLSVLVKAFHDLGYVGTSLSCRNSQAIPDIGVEIG